MKNFILSIVALLAVSAASAQSYPKQPDKTVVQYISYYKAPAKEKKADADIKAESTSAKETNAKTAQPVVRDEKLKKSEAVMPKNGTGVAVTGNGSK
ncbi:MAG: hypothetical protein EOO45_07475 [Flavobacterium sp.]|nr:MAG: hypothetical protein EOO45_07475 [Flavobacterium sp.]